MRSTVHRAICLAGTLLGSIAVIACDSASRLPPPTRNVSNVLRGECLIQVDVSLRIIGFDGAYRSVRLPILQGLKAFTWLRISPDGRYAVARVVDQIGAQVTRSVMGLAI